MWENLPGTFISFQLTQTVPVFVLFFFNRQSVISSIVKVGFLKKKFFQQVFRKIMARIQTSFLRFYWFRPQQHNTTFLLISKGGIKYPGVSFPQQPKPFTLSTTFSLFLGQSSFSFTIINEGTLFIYLFGHLYFSLKHNSKPSLWIFRCIPLDTSRFWTHTP